MSTLSEGILRVIQNPMISCSGRACRKTPPELTRWTPGIWGFIVEQLVALAGPLVAYLSLRATTSRKPIKVEGGPRFSFELKPDATDGEKAALVQLLAEYGELHPE
jgi:hypothetical protein